MPEVAEAEERLPEEALEARVAALVEQRVTERVAALEERLAALEKPVAPPNRVTIVAHSGDLDRLLSAFGIATGAAAMGMEVSIFFTFWGLLALKRSTAYAGKSLAEKMIAALLPGGPTQAATSQLNMLGVGPAFFGALMKKHHVETLPEMIDLAEELGVRFVACQMSMDIMGTTRDELREGIEFGGAATYLSDAAQSRVTLFI